MPTKRTEVRRLPKRGSHDRAAIDAILDEGIVAHVGILEGTTPFVMPTGYVRDGDRLLLHGSSASRLMKTLATGAEACVTVTLLDGIILARSAFHHSMNYRSVVVFGRGKPIAPGGATNEALRIYMERFIPGRWDVVRQPDKNELAGTLVVEFPLTEASAKSRVGPPGDDPPDLDFPVWAGVLPLSYAPFAPTQDPIQKPMPVPSHAKNWRPDRRGKRTP